MSKKTSKNLVGVERSIQVFDKSHNMVQEIEMNISIEELLKKIGSKEDDPFLYGFYKLTNE